MRAEQDQGMDATPAEITARTIDAACETTKVHLALVLIAFQLMFEVFDFFIVGFLVSVVGPAWGLTFGEIAIILLAGGVGMIFGSLAAGLVADRIGRKPVFVTCAVAYSACAGILAFIPEGNWIAFALVRLLVGMGFGGAGIAQITYVSEMVSSRRRLLVGGLVQIPISIGLLLAALSASMLLPVLGWRGLAAIGAFPIFLAVAQALVTPESVRWQITRLRVQSARKTLQALLKHSVDEPLVVPAAPRRGAMRELMRHPRECMLLLLGFFGAGLAVNGILLWGPTIVANLLNVSASSAASWFIVISLMGLVGRGFFTWLPQRVGRRRAGEIMGYCGALALACAAIFGNDFVGPLSIFGLAICIATFFCDGGYANLTPCAPESFPFHLAASGTGFAQACGGVAKIIAPVLLATVAGSNNVISPAATQGAVGPAFGCFAFAMLVVGAAFTIFGPEIGPVNEPAKHKKRLETVGNA